MHLPASESEVLQLQCGRCRWVVLWPWPTHETWLCTALAVLCSGWQQQGMLLAQRCALRHLLRTGRPGNLHIPWGGVAPVFDFLIISFYYFPDTSPQTRTEDYISYLTFYWGQRQTIQINPRTSPCRKSQRQSKGKWKIACAFKFLHNSDVWAKNIYYTLMSVPKQVWSAAFLYSCACQGMWASWKDSIIFILPSTSSLFGSIL